MTDEFATPGPSPRDYVPRGDAEARAKVPRDQWDRYLMPFPDGTKPAKNKGLTRVSTLKSGLSNQTGIKVWTGQKIVEGLGQDTQLVEDAMRAATIIDPEDRKRALRKVADRAFVAGGGKDRSGKGTEFHEVTENLNRSGLRDAEMVNPDDSLKPDLGAYYQMLSDNDVQILPDMLERQVLCPYNSAGTFDNMVRWWNPDTEEWELCIADLKTGRSLELGWLEILMQLWSYANAYALWTTTKVITASDGTITDVQGYYEPMPLELRKDKALIFHVPLDGTATLYVLDLSGVERYVAAAVEAKRANAEAKHKVRKVATVTPAAFVQPDDPGLMGSSFVGNTVTFTPAQVGNAVAEGIMHGRVQVATTATTEAFHQPEPDGPWAPVRQDTTITGAEFVINGPTPTPDQVAQAVKAAERMTVAEQTLARAAEAAGVTVKVDGRQITEHPMFQGGQTQFQAERAADTVTRVAAASNPNDEDAEDGVPYSRQGLTPRQISSADNRSDGTPPSGLDPVTGRKKRTCGHCRKPGHTQKNCPENPASDKFQGDVGETSPPPAAQAYVPPGEHGPALGTEPLTGAEREADALLAQPENRLAIAVEAAGYGLATAEDRRLLAEQPWCALPPPHAHEWTSTHPAAPGQWVCSVSGKPSEQSYRNPGSNQVAVGTIAPPAWTAPSDTIDYAAVVLGRIDAANTQAELLRLRADAIEAGHWVESLHNDRAMARYQALA